MGAHPAPQENDGEQLQPGTIAGTQLADVSSAIVQLHRRWYGRGPTRARATYSNDVLTVVLSDIYTTVEQTLVDHGRSDLVFRVRTVFQETMRHEFVAAIERAVGRTVVSFTSGADVEHSHGDLHPGTTHPTG